MSWDVDWLVSLCWYESWIPPDCMYFGSFWLVPHYGLQHLTLNHWTECHVHSITLKEFLSLCLPSTPRVFRWRILISASFLNIIMAWQELNLPSCPLFYSPLYVLVIFPMALSVAQPRPLWYQLQLFSNIRQPIIIPSLMSHCVANRASSKTIIVPLEYNAKKQKKCKEFVVIECTEGWVLCTY